MRLGECHFTPTLPANFRTHISIWHPGYIRGEDTMFSLPRLDAADAQDDTDDDRNAEHEQAERYGVHFGTMLLACQIIAGNSFNTAYLSHDRKGENRVQLSRRGILMRDHYYLHVPQEDGSDTNSYPVTPNFQEWRFPHTLPEPWQSLAPTQRDIKPSCIVSGSLMSESAHVIPQAHDKWWTDNAMSDYSLGARSVSNSDDNIMRLRVDLHRVFDKRAFALVPKPDPAGGGCHLVVHFFSILKDFGDTALDIHNRKVHSLDTVAVQFLFARFALTVFAYTKDFILRGERRKIVVVQRGIDDNDSPTWVTNVVNMERAQRQGLYGGGGSRGSSPSKRSRRTESQVGDDYDDFGEEEEEKSRGRLRVKSWLMGNAGQEETEDNSRPSKRRRISCGQSQSGHSYENLSIKDKREEREEEDRRGRAQVRSWHMAKVRQEAKNDGLSKAKRQRTSHGHSPPSLTTSLSLYTTLDKVNGEEDTGPSSSYPHYLPRPAKHHKHDAHGMAADNYKS